MQPPEDKPGQVPARSVEGLGDIIWHAAWSACIRAFLVLLLGGIAVSIVGGILRDMTPSAPPGFGGKPQLEPESSPVPMPTNMGRIFQFHHVPGAWLTQHQFFILAGVFFCFGLWQRFRSEEQARIGATPTRSQKILKHAYENWFGLVVGNAFGAMISAIVLVAIQQVSAAQIYWHIVSSWVEPVAQGLLGNAGMNTVQQWWAWYGANQLKFNFWLFYLAAISDDLGLPNFKTLGRWLGRRWRNRVRRRSEPSLPVSGA